MDLRQDGVVWTGFMWLSTDQWRALVNTVVDVRVLRMFLSICTIGSFLGRASAA
jgi:hypothetical protein